MAEPMKKLICLLVLVIATSGCGYSLLESHIRSQRPDYLKTWTDGLVSPLSQEDIQEAIEFGKVNKHSQEIIYYAFMSVKEVFSLGSLIRINTMIYTNYYLIADYAAKQSRNYNPIDTNYVNFLANLPTFRIEVIEAKQPVGSQQWFQIEKNFVLLKDGVKIKESDENPLYEKKSPYPPSRFAQYYSSWKAETDAVIRQSMEMAKQIANTYQVKTFSDIPETKPTHLYNYKDIDTSTEYEIVVIYEDGEKRILIDFSNIK